MLTADYLGHLLEGWPENDTRPEVREDHRYSTGWWPVFEHLAWGPKDGVLSIGDITVHLEDYVDGQEGDWNKVVHMVFRTVHDGDTQWWRKDGHYRSHVGTEWDEDCAPLYEVVPRPREVVEFLPF